MSILITLGIITTIFVLLILLKSIIKKEYCAICASVTITWITLTILYTLKIFNDAIIIGILIGQTIHGIYTITQKYKKISTYRLPIILTLTTIGYYTITQNNTGLLPAITSLAIVWAIATMLNARTQNQTIKKIREKIVQCCKNW